MISVLYLTQKFSKQFRICIKNKHSFIIKIITFRKKFDYYLRSYNKNKNYTAMSAVNVIFFVRALQI